MLPQLEKTKLVATTVLNFGKLKPTALLVDANAVETRFTDLRLQPCPDRYQERVCLKTRQTQERHTKPTFTDSGLP